MIIEGLISTTSVDGEPHLAAMGVSVDHSWQRFELRPFCETQTFQNLQQTRQAVFHTSDDVVLLVQIITGERPKMQWKPASKIDGFVLCDACRFFELSVAFADVKPPRATFGCAVLNQAQLRTFSGFNRAKHLVLEAAILATRLDFLPVEEIRSKWAWFSPIIRRTGGENEIQAFQHLSTFVEKNIGTILE